MNHNIYTLVNYFSLLKMKRCLYTRGPTQTEKWQDTLLMNQYTYTRVNYFSLWKLKICLYTKKTHTNRLDFSSFFSLIPFVLPFSVVPSFLFFFQKSVQGRKNTRASSCHQGIPTQPTIYAIIDMHIRRHKWKYIYVDTYILYAI